MDILPTEIFYHILDFLDFGDIINIYNSHKIIENKIRKYVVSLIFVNHKLKENTIFKLELAFLLLHLSKLINIIGYITNNDFNDVEYHSNIFININSDIDINGYAVFEYYYSYLKGIDYYIFPELDLDYLQKFKKIKSSNKPTYQIYYEEEIELRILISNFIKPRKDYQTINYFNTYENLINSNLI
jgi:hypothetical protein